MGMYSVTPIGSASATASAVAGAYVDYLDNGQPMRGIAKQNNLDGTVSYYADAIEGPGMWNGHGAARLGLYGEVDPDHLKSLLEGRHHETGERLTTARGSAGRHGLKVGQPTMLIDSRPVWSPHDLQQRFELDDDTFDELVDKYAIGTTEHDGELFYEVGAVSHLADALDTEDKSAELTDGDPNDLFSTRQAATILGLTPQYIGRVIGHHEQLKQTPDGLEDATVDWLPATRKGRGWKIKRSDVVAFDERRTPPAVRLAYDVTFTFEKSVSILGLLSDGPTRDIVTQAILDANAAGLQHFDQHASNGRAKGQPIGSEGLAAATYLHATSRNDDPFLHAHNVIANVIEDANGIGRTIDGRDFYLESPTAAALASAELRWQLNQQLGVGFYARENGVEVAGIPTVVREAFSSRSKEVEDLVDKISATAAQRARAAQLSRPNKGEKTVEELYEGWWETCAQHDFTPEQLSNVIGNGEILAETLTDSERTALLTHLGSANGVTKTRSVFTYGDVVRSIGDWTPEGSDNVRLIPAAQTKVIADEFITSFQVVPLDIDKGDAELAAGKSSAAIRQSELFSTRRMLKIHNQIDQRWAKGLSNGGADVQPDVLAQVLEDNPALTDDQADFITQWVTSGHQFQSGTGVPGAGKTFTMSAAKDAWEASDYRVIGAAVKGTAARELASVGVESFTIARLLDDHNANLNPLDTRTVLIVDEASTLGDEQLHTLLGIANDTGASIRFLGDPEQHQSVPAGGMWTHLVRSYAPNTPELTESHRFKDAPVDLAANDAIRDDRILDAFKILSAAGQLHEEDTRSGAYEVLLRRAIKTRAEGNIAPIVEQTNIGRQILNDAMQQIRIDAGEVTDAQSYERQRFGVGDDVIARQPNKKLYPEQNPDAHIRNGFTGTVVAATATSLTVEFGGLGIIGIPTEAINGAQVDGNDLLQLGYSLTSYSIQGSTHPLSTSGVRRGASKAELIVDLSRGEKDNVLVIGGTADDHMQAFKEHNPDGLQDQVAQHATGGAALTAGPADPTAIDRDMNLGRIHAIGEEHHDHIVAVEQAQRLAIIAHPPADIVSHLPNKPEIPHLRQQWEDAVVTAGLYAARYTPRPNATAPWGYSLGSGPDPAIHPERHDAWQHAIKELSTASLDITLRTINDTSIAPEPLPAPEVEPPSERPTDKLVARLKWAQPTRQELRTIDTVFNELIDMTEAAEKMIGYRQKKFDRQFEAIDNLASELGPPANINAASRLVANLYQRIERDFKAAEYQANRLDEDHKKHPVSLQRAFDEAELHKDQLYIVKDLKRHIHASHSRAYMPGEHAPIPAPTPQDARPNEPAPRIDTAQRVLSRLDRITASVVTEIDHELARTTNPDARAAVSFRQDKLSRHADYQARIAEALSAPADIADAAELADELHQRINRDHHRASSRVERLDDSNQTRTAGLERAIDEAAFHGLQLDLATELRHQLQTLHVNQPSPLEVHQTHQAIHQARTQPDPWIPQHIEQLAKENRLTPHTNLGLLGEWAGQASLYKAKWDADPTATKGLDNPIQAAERTALQQLHDVALDPVGTQPEIDLTLDMDLSL